MRIGNFCNVECRFVAPTSILDLLAPDSLTTSGSPVPRSPGSQSSSSASSYSAVGTAAVAASSSSSAAGTAPAAASSSSADTAAAAPAAPDYVDADIMNVVLQDVTAFETSKMRREIEKKHRAPDIGSQLFVNLPTYVTTHLTTFQF
jgi:BRCT domain type II-containing protein